MAKPYNFNSMIRSAARRIWMWSPMRKEAIHRARVPGLKPFHVRCVKCGLKMREGAEVKQYAVDHIVPASEPAAAILDWNDFFKRLNVPAATGLQVLCHQCHAVKTESENERRKSKRAKPKKKPSTRKRKG